MEGKEIQFYTLEEIAQLVNSDEKLVYINDGIAETIGKYDDMADIIVDLNRKFGEMNLKIYDFDEGVDKPLLSTNGMLLDKCDSEVRKYIIGRLIKLQFNLEKVKDYKLIDEYDLEKYYEFLNKVYVKGEEAYERD